MTDLYLDRDSNDIAIEDGDLVIIELEQLLALQSVTLILKTFRGEWAFNTNFGVPYAVNENNDISLLGLGVSQKQEVDATIKESILSSPHITSIIQYRSTMDQESGRFKIEAEASCRGGTIIINEEVQL